MWAVIGDAHIHIHELFMEFLYIYKVILEIYLNSFKF